MDEPAEDQRLSEVIAAYLEAVDAGWAPARADLLAHYPELSTELRAFFDCHDEVARIAVPAWPTPLPPPHRHEDTGHKAETSAHPEPPTAVLAQAAPACPLPTTPRCLGDYELLEEIKRGGMGIVYRARQRSLNRTVALKVMIARPDSPAADLQRFRSEAEAAANLDHPNIVPIYEVGEADGRGYFSMKLIEGGSLSDHLGEFVRDQKASARLLAQVARAVHHAHRRGVLHRDLKPGNVLLEFQGSRPAGVAIPYVGDFGLAKRLSPTGALPSPAEATPLPRALQNGRAQPAAATEGASLTEPGVVVGTPSYMAPEQAGGGKGVTTAADVYGLGALLYELLTGKPPFDGGSLEGTLALVRECEPTPPTTLNPRVDARLEAVCLKCLAKDPAGRYASAEALAEDLERWLHGEPPLAWPMPWGLRVWRAVRQSLLVGTVAAACGFAAALLLFVYYTNPNRTLDATEARLDRGDAVTLLGEQGPPVWSRWNRGGAACLLFDKKDAPFAVSTLAAGLLELLPDPRKERYRFSVEVRHDDVANAGNVGLYFGFTTYPTSTGVAHYWCELTFADRGATADIRVAAKSPNAGPHAKVELALRRQLEPVSHSRRTLTPVFKEFPTSPRGAQTPCGAWRWR